MIRENQEYHLGHKAFFLFLSKRMVVVMGLVIAALVIAIAEGAFLQAVFGAPSAAGAAAGSGLAVASAVFSYIVSGLFLLAILFFLGGFTMSWLEYHHYSFSFEEFGVKVTRGLFTKEEVSIPYRQMQDINVRRTLSYQLMSLSRLIIESAGEEEKGTDGESDVILDPLDKDMAESIRVFLQRRIGVQVVVDEHHADEEARKEGGVVV